MPSSSTTAAICANSKARKCSLRLVLRLLASLAAARSLRTCARAASAVGRSPSGLPCWPVLSALIYLEPPNPPHCGIGFPYREMTSRLLRPMQSAPDIASLTREASEALVIVYRRRAARYPLGWH